jgi:hypothetical protein
MLFYITSGAAQAVPRTACVEDNRTACIEVYCSSESQRVISLICQGYILWWLLVADILRSGSECVCHSLDWPRPLVYAKVYVWAHEAHDATEDGLQRGYHSYPVLAPWCPGLSLRVWRGWLPNLWYREHYVGWSSGSTSAAICSLPLSHPCSANPASSVSGCSWGLQTSVWLLPPSSWGYRSSSSWSTGTRFQDWGWGYSTVWGLWCSCIDFFWWWWGSGDSATNSCATSFPWSWGWWLQCCSSNYCSCSWPYFGYDPSVSYSAVGSHGSGAGSSGSRAGQTGRYPAAVVQVDVVHVSDHSGLLGHPSAAAVTRQGRASAFHDSHPSAHRCSDPSSAVRSSSYSSGCGHASYSVKTPAPFFWFVHLFAQAGHPGLLGLGHRWPWASMLLCSDTWDFYYDYVWDIVSY